MYVGCVSQSVSMIHLHLIALKAYTPVLGDARDV